MIYIDLDYEISQRENERFLGFTIDADQLRGDSEMSCLSELNNEALIILLKELRPATVRLGGTGIDYTCVSKRSDDPLPPGKYYVCLDSRKCDAISDFCRGVGASLVLGLPTMQNNGNEALEMARYFAERFTGLVTYFELGNEPELWPNRGVDYVSKVITLSDSLKKEFPKIGIIAGYKWLIPYTKVMELVEKTAGSVDVYSSHFYACSSVSKNANTPFLLDECSTNVCHSGLAKAKFFIDTHSPNSTVGCTEFNTFSSKGVDGLSNAGDAALWTADFIGSLFQHGCSINHLQCGFARQHGKQPFWQYAMIDTRHGIRINPHYYSFLFWNRFMGTKLYSVLCNEPRWISAYATSSDGASIGTGNVRIMIINKNESTRNYIAVSLLGYKITQGAICIIEVNKIPLPKDCIVWPEGVKPSFRTVKVQSNGTISLQVPPFSITLLCCSTCGSGGS